MKNPMFGITEVKIFYEKRQRGFHVRLGWKDKRPRIERVFNVKDYESHMYCLQAAKHFRDTELQKLKDAGEWPVKVVYTKPWKNNKSGVIGVHRSHQYGKQRGNIVRLDCYRWTASWFVEGKIKTASFGETKWGANIAFQMACDCREARKNIYTGQ